MQNANQATSFIIHSVPLTYFFCWDYE
ncbi:unnamed protein product [Spirodela intermedia]|uniref:Uncharacterized protein n=2 Tax=Spirodela intermedia TaxID=51605 RepID=A0A7I8KUM6_SPIIN|nr:unnamed protein product [Spirodela intermedia]CAA7400798.1 unnamed protein product [Spirodela intermedia]